MDFINNYKDLCKQLEIHSETIDALETERYGLEKLLECNKPKDIKAIDYSGQPIGSKDFTSYDRTIARIAEISRKIKIEKELYGEMNDSKEKIKTQVEALQGINYRVAYMRDIKGMKLEDIANELNKSLDWIRHISVK